MEQMGQGLAGQMAGQTQGMQISVEEVAQLLEQGVDPEQLLQRGVPMEVIEQAVQLLMAMEQQKQGMQPDARQVMQEPRGGLGAAMVQQGM